MKYLKQFFWILFISLLGELLGRLLPLPVPASVYGILLMLFALKTGILKPSQVEDAADFFLEIMPVLFIPAGVGLLTIGEKLLSNLVPFLILTLLSTVIVMAVTGMVSQRILKRKEDQKK